MTLQAKIFLGFLVLLVVWRILVSITPKETRRGILSLGKKFIPVVLIAIAGVAAWGMWNKYQGSLATKPIEALCAYSNEQNYQKIYNLFAQSFHDLNKTTPQSFAENYQKTVNNEILSLEPIDENSIVHELSAHGTLVLLANELAFHSYQNKKLFKVSLYGENSEEDLKVNNYWKLYCAAPGIITEAYFGVIQEDAFTWKILFMYPTNRECAGENKYAQHLEDLKEVEALQRSTRRNENFHALNNLCKTKLSIQKHVHDPLDNAYYYSKDKAFVETVDRQRAAENQAAAKWAEQIEDYCYCAINKVYSKLSDDQIEDLKNDFWENRGLIRMFSRNCKEPDLIKVSKYRYSNYSISFW